MADKTKVHVVSGNGNMIESMTKEEIMTAIVNAIEQGEIGDIDTGFVTSLKEQNGGQALKFWVGTQAQYNAITTPEKNVFYIISDDSTENDLEEAIENLEIELNNMQSAVEQSIDELSNEIDEIDTKTTPANINGSIYGTSGWFDTSKCWWRATKTAGIACVTVRVQVVDTGELYPEKAYDGDEEKIAVNLPKCATNKFYVHTTGSKNYEAIIGIDQSGNLYFRSNGAKKNLNNDEYFFAQLIYPYSE